MADGAGAGGTLRDWMEARLREQLAPARLDVIVHPQSIVHGLIAWRDGAVTAGLAMPDMRVPIAHCLGLGDRLEIARGRPLDLAATGSLTFEPADEARLPCLRVARAALARSGGWPGPTTTGPSGRRGWRGAATRNGACRGGSRGATAR